ncbi:hypothetical protein Hbl1158_09180 [Halobaculum sp. CBA1158]|uniref:hypothetical protein n=1 Tax=Halobaculum sp. CBA1158 TaxID=2904243 RepID=UPI001F3AD7C5|nr:hypothetical protein [Halobaculum sp. CBA1158]UIO98720.1 hypothetical protein Hbl1158_09180 [Halobaculum sp. CBA1158]
MASRQGAADAADSSAHTGRGGSSTNTRARARSPSLPERGRDVSAPPDRDPSRYAQTDHFRRRLRQQGRYITLPTAGDAIRNGQLRWNSTDGWRFAVVRDGVRFVVVVGDTDTPSPVLVTGWTEIADWDEALASDRWSECDVHTIRLRAALSEHKGRQIPGRIRPRIVTRPFEVSGHRVVTAAGDGHVECDDCGARFRSKRELCELPCDRR